ncbi:MAG: hypothetical protein UT69_C0027G0003 [Candidatus Yanofskybacteria bacterium GW2011_GWE1_40_10]|nr:MAG: hypothetical protein UT69_C0027G0003 [Candidatus Yanofskybacteria bacterium GW2011_GWE1_40_10]
MTKKQTDAQELPAVQGKSKEYEVGNKKPPMKSRWKPGQSGNPKGSNKKTRNKKYLEDLIDKILNDESEVTLHGRKQKMTEEEINIRRIMRDKNINGFLTFMERRYGKVPQAMEVTGKDGGEVILRVVREETKKIDGA